MERKRVAFYTLGCKLNFSETSTIARQFEQLGYQRVRPSEEADIYVVNTCSVTEQADRKCRQAIRRFNALAPHALIAVVGCYAQLQPQQLASIKGVGLVLGANEKGNLPIRLHSTGSRAGAQVYGCHIDDVFDFFPAFSTADRTRSFLKVQDGCDYHCSYCTIPLARGRSRNIPIAQLVEQANQIASEGVQEIVLTGVNTGDFGRTSGESFADLLGALQGVSGIERIRISSVEPNLITEDIIGRVAHSSKLLPHFHIPLQSGSNKILASMRRRYNSQLFADKIESIRRQIPHAFIGVDVIVGFPGETEEDFMQSYNLLQSLGVSALHVFPYSPRPNTPAANMGGKVTQRIVTDRVHRLVELSNQLQAHFYQLQKGVTQEVLFESARKGNTMFGFTRNYVKVEHPYTSSLVNRIVKVKLLQIAPSGNYRIGTFE